MPRKMMVSLSPETERKLRTYVREHYYNRVGALSIVVETAIRKYFNGLEPQKTIKPK